MNMAIAFGLIFADGRNKLGNLIASKNRWGTYYKAYVIPFFPNTVTQQNANQLFSDITKNWSLLSDQARGTWRDSVNNWKCYDIFGDELIYSGFQLYCKLNFQAQYAGFPALTNSPVKMFMPDFTLQSATYTTPPKRINLTLSATDPSVTLQIFATTQMLSQVKYWKSRMRLIQTVASDSINATQLYNAYKTKFGPIIANDNIYIGIKKVLSNGQSAPIQTLKLST